MKSNKQKVDEKVKSGKALTRRELAFASGYSYEEILEFSREAEFPIFHKKTRYSEFWRWRRQKMEVELNSHTPTNPPHSAEYKFGVLNQSHDLPVSLPPKVAHLLARAG